MDSVVNKMLERMMDGLTDDQVEVFKDTMRQVLANATR
jgi:hypothetical protein